MHLNKGFVVQNLKITKKNSSQSFLSDTCQEINVEMKGKNSINGINLNKDDWMFEKGIKMHNQCKIFKL